MINDAYIIFALLQGFALQVIIALVVQILPYLMPHFRRGPVFVTSYLYPTSKSMIFAF